MGGGEGVRFIPAGAGNTAPSSTGRPSNAVHPRWRGEHASGEPATLNVVGSSPLARGTHPRQQPGPRQIRFIPAGAGNTRLRASMARSRMVHPRWRGEHGSNVPDLIDEPGSSPLARGTHSHGPEPRQASRFIPAGAGNTQRHRVRQRQTAVHPRWRGEHPASNRPSPCTPGSSPLARGTLAHHIAPAKGSRFIPAGAGNTNQLDRNRSPKTVHPRWRGEHFGGVNTWPGYAGSSPLARGTPPSSRRQRAHRRFIPAGAGNTRNNFHRASRPTVHPRWRGEHSRTSMAAVISAGSSPLARGTRSQRA